MQEQVKMYALRILYMDSWSGPEYGDTLYFRTEEEARQYCSAYNKRYNTAARAPECYTTHEGEGYVWVEMAKLELKVTELGIYCTLTS